MRKVYDLILLDVDGSEAPYPGVIPTLDALPGQPQIVLVSNQGGVGLRAWIQEINRNKGIDNNDHEKYPDIYAVRRRLTRIGGAINAAAVYVALSYQSKSSGAWWPPTEEATRLDDEAAGEQGWLKTSWDHYWRKPHPGMVIQASLDLGIKLGLDKILLVGDRDEDQEAASRAGVDFLWAREFFGRDDGTD